jgi:hypothetical protein
MIFFSADFLQVSYNSLRNPKKMQMIFLSAQLLYCREPRGGNKGYGMFLGATRFS